jgi:hypothetical protein
MKITAFPALAGGIVLLGISNDGYLSLERDQL